MPGFKELIKPSSVTPIGITNILTLGIALGLSYYYIYDATQSSATSSSKALDSFSFIAVFVIGVISLLNLFPSWDSYSKYFNGIGILISTICAIYYISSAATSSTNKVSNGFLGALQLLMFIGFIVSFFGKTSITFMPDYNSKFTRNLLV